MAAPAAPTPWNRLPLSADNFRWWDNIYLKFSLPGSFDETPTVHKQILAKPHHGKTHKLLVPTLEASFPTIDAASFAKVQGDETLKKSSFHSPQTTQSQRIHHNQLGTTSHGTRRTPQLLYLEPVLRGIPHVPQRAPKHPGACPKIRSVEVLRRGLPLPKQQHRLLSRRGLDHRRKNRRHFPPIHPHPIHKDIGDHYDGRDKDSSGNRDLTAIDLRDFLLAQGSTASDPRDIYGHYESFCHTMNKNNSNAISADASTRPRSQSCSHSRSHPKPGPSSNTRAATPISILEVLNSKEDKAKDNPAVEAMEETFASIASRPPSPRATRFTIKEAAIAAAMAELAVAISKHRDNFQTMLSSSIRKITPARENRLRANNMALMTSATIRV